MIPVTRDASNPAKPLSGAFADLPRNLNSQVDTVGFCRPHTVCCRMLPCSLCCLERAHAFTSRNCGNFVIYTVYTSLYASWVQEYKSRNNMQQLSLKNHTWKIDENRALGSAGQVLIAMSYVLLCVAMCCYCLKVLRALPSPAAKLGSKPLGRIWFARMRRKA